MRDEPLVSVIMGVHNTKIEYLHLALDSILTQTYHNLEFIVVDDASESWCADFLRNYQKERQEQFSDARIRLIHNVENRGLTASLNIALRIAQGCYVARMDSDDICLPNRIKEQVAYMQEHTDIDVLACGTYIYEGKTLLPGQSDISANRQFAGIYKKFEQERQRVRLSLANIEFTHPTVIFRKKFLVRNDLWYDESIKKAQDYNMWVRCIERGKLDSLQKVLFISRIHEQQIGVCQIEEQNACADMTKIRCLKRLIPEATKQEELLYTRMRDTKIVGRAAENISLIKELIRANDAKKIYDTKIYRQEIFFWWLRKSLYKENRTVGWRILANSYMFLNILRIAIPQVFRYVMDLIYKNRIKMNWIEEIQQWVRENG